MNTKYESIEMNASHMQSKPPSAFLYCNGSAVYFDENGKQIPELQLLGLCALSEYIKRFPKSKIYWGIWRGGNQEMDEECVKGLLKHLKEVSPQQIQEGI